MIDIKAVKISFDYSGKEVLDIKRCLETLYSTMAGTIPLDREFGIDYNFIDYPDNIARNLFSVEIIEKTENYEPRVYAEEVTFQSDGNGMLIPTVHIVLNTEIEGE